MKCPVVVSTSIRTLPSSASFVTVTGAGSTTVVRWFAVTRYPPSAYPAVPFSSSIVGHPEWGSEKSSQYAAAQCPGDAADALRLAGGSVGGRPTVLDEHEPTLRAEAATRAAM